MKDDKKPLTLAEAGRDLHDAVIALRDQLIKPFRPVIEKILNALQRFLT